MSDKKYTLRPAHLPVYFLLTLLMLGLVPALSLVFNDGSMDFSEAAARASEASGIAWTSNLIDVVRLSLVEPVLLLTMIGSLAPFLAALCLMLFLRQGEIWRRFWLRLRPFSGVSYQAAAMNYALIFILLTVSLFFVFELRHLLGVEYQRDIQLNYSILIAIFLIAFLDQGAVLEELGWRGFLSPEMQQMGIQPLATACIVGVLWGLWHLPRDITTGVIERLGAFDYLLLFLPSFITGTIAVSIIAVYFMNRLGGSVIPAIVIHGITNDAVGISGSASITEALTPFHQITKNLPFALIALGLVFVSGAGLGYHKEKGTE
jgi:hypothetical protein